MHVRWVWCAVTALALAGAAGGLAGCSEGAKPTPVAVPQGGVEGGGADGGVADGRQAPAAPQGMGVPKPGKAVTAAAPAVKGPPKGKVPAKLQGNSPQAEPF